MRFIDLFSGIGGFRLGMEQAGHTCVGHVEIDKFANISYQAIHRPSDEEFFRDDIKKITDDEWASLRGRVDCICAGFPCQAFSIARHRRGFLDTRGTLFFEVARATKQIKPRFLLLENVKGLLSHDKGETFGTILRTLDELGYDAEWQVLNSKDFGVPQNRERVFIVGYPRGQSGREVFPIAGNNKEIDFIYTMSGGGREPKILVKSNTQQGYEEACIDDSINLENPNSKTRRGRVGKGVSQTITTSPQIAVLMDGARLRKLTSKECWRLQSFPDWAFDRAKEAGLSDSQLYKQAGNSVTVNVIYEIARRLE